MTSYLVDAFVKKQSQHEACWASICTAVAKTLKPKIACKDPIDLYTHWKATNGKSAQNPTEVLRDSFAIESDEKHYRSVVSTAGESSLRAADIANIVTEALSQNVPVICGLTTHDNAPLGYVDSKPIKWFHAVLLYKCDTVRKVCWLRDPAPGGGKASLADRLVTFDELASGFIYMNKSDFGDQTRALLGTSVGPFFARALKLIVPSTSSILAGELKHNS